MKAALIAIATLISISVSASENYPGPGQYPKDSCNYIGERAYVEGDGGDYVYVCEASGWEFLYFRTNEQE